MHPADKHIRAFDGPRAITRICKICGHHEITRKPRPGTAGRGWGMREGNKQRGLLIQHIKSVHPEVICEEESR